MQAIKSTGTREEVRLAKALWKKGYRYRKNDKSVFGKPDLTLKKYHVAVFVDGEYFHGKDWQSAKYRIQSNRRFWWRKIEKNIERDQLVNAHLEKDGWTVLRFWSNDVRKNVQACITAIERAM